MANKRMGELMSMDVNELESRFENAVKQNDLMSDAIGRLTDVRQRFSEVQLMALDWWQNDELGVVNSADDDDVQSYLEELAWNLDLYEGYLVSNYDAVMDAVDELESGASGRDAVLTLLRYQRVIGNVCGCLAVMMNIKRFGRVSED